MHGKRCACRHAHKHTAHLSICAVVGPAAASAHRRSTASLRGPGIVAPAARLHGMCTAQPVAHGRIRPAAGAGGMPKCLPSGAATPLAGLTFTLARVPMRDCSSVSAEGRTIAESRWAHAARRAPRRCCPAAQHLYQRCTFGAGERREARARASSCPPLNQPTGTHLTVNAAL